MSVVQASFSQLLNVLICLNCREYESKGKFRITKNKKEIITCIACQKPLARISGSNQLQFIKDGQVTGLEGAFNPDKFNPEMWSNWRVQNLDFIKKRVRSGGLIIDIGSGPGVFNSFFEGCTIIGVDFTSHRNVNIVTNLENELPLQSNCADVILMLNFLEHSYTPMVALKSAARVLKPGGKIFITVPFLMSTHQEPHDYHRYTNFCLTRMLQSNGFVVEEIEAADDIITFSSLAERFFRYHIGNGNRFAKLIWQLEKMILVSIRLLNLRANRPEYTIGYMMEATKK
jgi:SAM-dependent methyltransferase